MKKKLISMLCAGIVLTSLTACGGGGGDKDWAYIEQKKEMVVGITYFEPMNYFNASNELVGFETEFTKAVCEVLGVTPKFQEISWAAKETELNAKNIDCIWNGMTINEERLANMSISQPYLRNKQVLIVKKENAGLYGDTLGNASVVAEKSSAGEAAIEAEDFFKDAAYTAVDTQAKALMEVSSGTADGCVVDYVLSIGMIGEGTDYDNLTVFEGQDFGEEEYGVALRKDDTEFTKKVNDAIDTLRGNGKLAEIASKYKLQELLVTN